MFVTNEKPCRNARIRPSGMSVYVGVLPNDLVNEKPALERNHGRTLRVGDLWEEQSWQRFVTEALCLREHEYWLKVMVCISGTGTDLMESEEYSLYVNLNIMFGQFWNITTEIERFYIYVYMLTHLLPINECIVADTQNLYSRINKRSVAPAWFWWLIIYLFFYIYRLVNI